MVRGEAASVLDFGTQSRVFALPWAASHAPSGVLPPARLPSCSDPDITRILWPPGLNPRQRSAERSENDLLGPHFSAKPFPPLRPTPQNLTSGRHSSWLTPKFLILEVIGLGGGTNLYHGISQPGRYEVRSPRSGKGQLPSRMAGYLVDGKESGCFQHGSLWDFALCHVTPERDQQFARQRNNCDPPDAPALIPHTRTKPAAQCAAWLVPHP